MNLPPPPTELFLLWKELEVTHDEQTNYTDKVKSKLLQLYHEEMDSLQKRKEELVRCINDELQRGRSLCTILDIGQSHISNDSLITYLQQLRFYNEGLERIKTERTIEKEGLYKEIKAACQALGQNDPERPNVTNLSLTAIKSLKDFLISLNDMRRKRQIELNEIAQEIFQLQLLLAEKPVINPIAPDLRSPLPQNIDYYLYKSKELKDIETIPITNEFLAAFQNRRDVLIGEKEHRLKQMEDLCSRISALYERLDIPFKERENVSSSYWCLTPTKEKIQILTSMYNQLEFRKNLMIKEFVDRAKERLHILHKELHIVGDNFDDYDDNILLEKLENEITKLQACKTEYVKVITLVHKRDELLEQITDLDKHKGDVSKYNNFARLREEELVRNRAKKLPETTYTLKKMIQEFESQFGITVRNKNGDPYLSVIMDYEANLTSQQKARCVRQHMTSSKPDLNTSKLNSSINVTPTTNRVVQKTVPTPSSVTKTLFTPPVSKTKPVTRTATVLDQTNGGSKSDRRPFKQLKM